MDCKEIISKLRWFAGNHKYALANAYVFDWESDFFSITKSGNLYEYEVKLNKADYRRDFTKRKHLFLKNAKAQPFLEKNPTVHNDWTGHNFIGYVDGEYQNRNAEYCRAQWHDPSKFKIPSRFYFVCPPGVITKADLPPYAGLILITHSCSIEKAAPILHNRTYSEMGLTQVLLDKFYHISERMRFRLSDADYKKFEEGTEL